MSPASASRAELATLLRLAVPLAVTQAGQALMGAVDVAVLGRAGAVPLAAAGLASALFFGISVFGMGVMHGLDPLVSQAVGAGDRITARRLVWQGAWLSAALSALLALPIMAAPALLRPLGISPEVAREAERYLAWRLPTLPFFFVYFAGRSYLQALGSLRPLVIAVAVANVANLAGDVLLVFGGAGLPAWTGPLRAVPAMGVAGAALASTACSALQAGMVGLAVRTVDCPAPWRALARPVRAELALAARVGIPAGLHMAAEAAFFSLASLLAGRLGTIPLAAHQIALQIASLSFTAVVGLGNAGSVRVGLAVGAGDRRAARRSVVAALAGGAAFMSCSAAFLLLFPDLVARAMTDDPVVISAAIPLLRVAAVFQLSDGLQGVGAGVLRGAGQTRFTFAANMVAYWVVGLPTSLALAFWLGLGVLGLWLGFVVSLPLVAASLVWRILHVSGRDIAPLAAHASG